MISHTTSVKAITKIACQINLSRTLNLAPTSGSMKAYWSHPQTKKQKAKFKMLWQSAFIKP